MIKYRQLILFFLLLSALAVKSQTYPSYGSEIDVTINGLSFDAMEAFISPDGNYLFFNNLNDGIDTKLFYSTKVNDSTFNYVGELNGTNQTIQPYLDAVPDMDSIGNFYWTSTRNYPAELDNLFHGTFNSGNVSNIGRVRGDFNKNIPGWLIMDHGISTDGQFLYFNNARFDGGGIPVETEIGVAQKVNDSTFTTLPNSVGILQNINDTNYLYYAPCISSDNLELYYTRFLTGPITPTTPVGICVAVRNTPLDTFSIPVVLFSETVLNIIEAPTLTMDKKIMYYHKKIVGSHKIVMRYRENTLSVENSTENKLSFVIYPNPTNEKIIIEHQGIDYYDYSYTIVDIIGQVVRIEQNISKNKYEINITNLNSGTYLISFYQNNNRVRTIKFIKN